MSEPLLKPGMTLVLPSFRLSDYPVTDAPVTKRCYRHIVGDQVWSKVVAFMSQAEGRRSKWVKSSTNFDYRTGSALEGNLVHWVANQHKRVMRETLDAVTPMNL